MLNSWTMRNLRKRESEFIHDGAGPSVLMAQEAGIALFLAARGAEDAKARRIIETVINEAIRYARIEYHWTEVNAELLREALLRSAHDAFEGR